MAIVVLLVTACLTLVLHRGRPSGSAGIVTDLTSTHRAGHESPREPFVPSGAHALTVLASTNPAAPPPPGPTADPTSTTRVSQPTTTAAPRPPPSRRNDTAAEALPPVVADPEQGEPTGYGGLGRLTRTIDAGVTVDLQTYPDPAVTYTPALRQWSIAVHDPRCERVVRVEVDFGDGTGMTVSGAGTIIPCQGPEGWNYGSSSHRYPGPGRYQLAVTVVMSPQAPPPTFDLHRARQLVVVTAS